MLRIHIEHESEVVRLRLEGKLVHPWVDELFLVWMDLATRKPGQAPISLDLSEVSFVDVRGKALLASMFKAGCAIHGSGPFISAVIEDIRSSVPSRPSDPRSNPCK
jgi:ABC-type transporter Mla MlaB component